MDVSAAPVAAAAAVDLKATTSGQLHGASTTVLHYPFSNNVLVITATQDVVRPPEFRAVLEAAAAARCSWVVLTQPCMPPPSMAGPWGSDLR